MTNTTDLVPAGGVQVVGRTLLTPAIFTSKETVDDILDQIRQEAERFKETRDISTAAGRAAIASFAYKIARSKTALDDLGKETVAEWKTKANAVDDERRRIREDLDALKDDVRKPLDEWEEKDRRRRSDHEAKLVEIMGTARFSTFEPTSEMVKIRINELAVLIGRNWEEFAERAAAGSKIAGDILDRELTAATRRERERAERDRLARELEERERVEREERIAREAREAAEQRERDAVEAARRETELAEQRAAAAERARQDAAAEAEHQRVFGHEGAIALIRAAETADPANTSGFLSERLEGLTVFVSKRDWEEFTDAAAEAYQSAMTSLERKIETALDREERDRRDRETRISMEARASEQKRQADAAAAAAAEQDRRENNRRIRANVRKKIAAAILETVAGFDIVVTTSVTHERIADAIADSIVNGEVPHVTVTF